MSSNNRNRGGGGGSSIGSQIDEIGVQDVFDNPGLLKLELMAHGLRMSKALQKEHLSRMGPSAFATANELDLVLPEGTAATVPVHPVLVADSPYVLKRSDEDYRIHADGKSVGAQLLAPPDFYSQKTKAGVPFARFATMHGGYLALSPIAECAFLNANDRCRFCSLQGTTPGSSSRVSVECIVEAARLAQAERAIQMIYLSVGYIQGPDSGVAALEPYVRELKKNFNVLVAVDALPPADNAWIDRTYAMGVDSVSYNLEIFGQEDFQRICPGPARAIGRKRYLEALGYAASVFPPGAVVSHLIVGLEPIQNTMEGIDALVKMGVVPVLPVFRPFKGVDVRATEGREWAELTTQQLSSVYAHLYMQLKARKIPMGWVRDISVVTTPMEGRFFVGGDSALSRFFAKMLGNDPHKRPSPRLLDLRRSLRVRELSDEDTE